MTTKTHAAPDHNSAPVDAMMLALAARRQRDAYVAGILARGVRSLAAGIGGWFRRQRTFAQLNQLDPRMMADIGLDRAAFAAGLIRRIEDNRTQAFATETLALVARPMTRNAAEPHLAPAHARTAANDSRRAA